MDFIELDTRARVENELRQRPAAEAATGSASANSQYESLPTVHANATLEQQRRQVLEKHKQSRIGAASVRLLDWMLKLLVRLVTWLIPSLARRNVEEGTSPVEKRVGVIMTLYGRYWRRVLGYILLVLTAGAVLILFSRIAAPDHRYDAAKRSDRLLRMCGDHGDRMRTLKMDALPVSDESLKTGILPCGTRISMLLSQLEKLHREHSSDGHRCLTAKHLNHSYAIISAMRIDKSIIYAFNPSNYAQIGSEGSDVVEHSDFFPRAGTLVRKRPNRAWLTLTDVNGKRDRVIMQGDTLHCVLYAWEILNGVHYQVWSSVAEKPASLD